MKQNSSTIPSQEIINPRIRQWILTILVPLGGMYSSNSQQVITDVLPQGMFNLGQIEAELTQAELHSFLRKEYRHCHIHNTSLPEKLRSNIALLAKLVGLNSDECSILEFAVALTMDRRLAAVARLLGEFDTSQLFDNLATLLDVSETDIRRSLASNSQLVCTGIFSLSNFDDGTLLCKLKLLSRAFADNLYCGIVSADNLLRDQIKRSAQARLKRADYSGVNAHLEILLPYLTHSLEQQRTGVNILLHGQPGTGKSELARLLAQLSHCQLYEVVSEDINGQAVQGHRRIAAYCAAQHFLSNQESMLLFDEVEDIFGCVPAFSLRAKSALPATNKPWINLLLETNNIPTIWICNSIRGIDPAFVRRFDFVIEVPLPSKEQRIKLLKHYSKGLLDKQTLNELASQEHLSPAVIERSASVITSIAENLDKPAQAMQLLIESTLQSQGHQVCQSRQLVKAIQGYNPSLINADVDLSYLSQGLINNPSARLCLYGPPGTGKTAYGYWLAEQLNKPIILKRASDLLGAYVGESERQIAAAFRQAEQQQAVLMIDEVDSFLRDRRTAKQSWEVSMVNEMLTQMENFSGVFIASTNMMEGLDQAALRRFDLKTKFDFLKAEQAWILFSEHCQQLNLSRLQKNLPQKLERLQYLTPGDFVAVARLARFRTLNSAEEFIDALASEVSHKEQAKIRRIGF